MPGSCCAPNCKSNYDAKGSSVRVYRFPTDPQRRAAGTKAVCREDFTPSKHTVLCENHFVPTDFVRSATYTDVQTGKVVEVPLERVRLKETAVPSVFANCPKYMSRPAVPARETPEEKKARLEAASLRKAIELSVAAQEEEDRRNQVKSFSEFCKALPHFSVSEFWTVIVKDSVVMFLDLALDRAPAVRSSVRVSADLCVDVFFGETRLESVSGVNVPSQLEDLRQLNEVLQCVEKLQICCATDGCQKAHRLLELVLRLLQDVCSEYEQQDLHGWHLEVVKFVSAQIELLLRNPLRYAPEMLVFAALLYTISPHAYRFIRSSMKVKLPHPATIRRLCSSYGVSPALEQQDACFLNYAKTILNAMKEHERTVTLMMDEIHIQAYFDYKGGYVTGAAANSSSPAKTAHVFMLQSLLSNHKDVVHILPVAQIDAKALHEFLRKLITELEVLGFRVVAVVSDNNSINRKAMTFFANPPQASIVYPHPADPSRPLFYILDPVHVLKSVRNNWLNQRNSGKCIYFPDPSSTDPKPPILTASFKALRELHEAEQNELLKIAPTLSLKALDPSNMERQNVKLALRIFNESTIAALNSTTIQHAEGTAAFIATIVTWWRIVNVKTPRKGERLRDDMQYPSVFRILPAVGVLETGTRVA
ncbi:hypothetical protein HPB48_015762 [Haemaphysalis longicornis]|uniref:THAP-type domain-containing protein n=1 Tax=Haemaphysalis longicornis TaxID=44386 RepID=A0A9J6GHF2_HAELO|nr:hypothetical protein HPB48_015762 [Haemaphysalis longicornis]